MGGGWRLHKTHGMEVGKEGEWEERGWLTLPDKLQLEQPQLSGTPGKSG